LPVTAGSFFSGEVFQVACLIQFLACLGLILVGLAVLVGIVKPDEALRRIGMFLALLLVGPVMVAVLVKELVFPAATAVWSAAKPGLAFAALVLGLLLIAWVAVGVIELYRNRNSGDHRAHPGEE
jgi:uncharacterized membrane protein